jgi:hypothetical protein
MLVILATAGGPLEDNLDLLERPWKNPAECLVACFSSACFRIRAWIRVIWPLTLWRSGRQRISSEGWLHDDRGEIS